MKKLTAIFSILFITLISHFAEAQNKKLWPYSEGVQYIYMCDSTGTKVSKLAARFTNFYNKQGQSTLQIREQNKSQTDPLALDTVFIDSMIYDKKERITLKATYSIINTDAFPSLRYEYKYTDSANMAAKATTTYDNGKLSGQSWTAAYKNSQGNDSLILYGKGTKLHANFTFKYTYYYNTDNKIERILREIFNAGSWQTATIQTFTYPPGDTVIGITKDTKGNIGYISKTLFNKTIFEEYGSNRIYSKYNKAGLVSERKSFGYDINRKEYLIANHSINNYDTNGAIIYNFGKTYTGGSFMGGNRNNYFYTLRPPEPPKKDSLAAPYNPKPPVSNYTQDTITTAIEENTDKVKTEFSVFPNPAQDIVYISASAQEKNVQAEFYGMDGKKIFTKQLQIQELRKVSVSLSGIKPGMYILRLQNENGQVYNKMLVKQ